MNGSNACVAANGELRRWFAVIFGLGGSVGLLHFPLRGAKRGNYLLNSLHSLLDQLRHENPWKGLLNWFIIQGGIPLVLLIKGVSTRTLVENWSHRPSC